MAYELNEAGRKAVASWVKENAPEWNVNAVLEKISEVLINRSEGESLEVEMRGPNYKGWNNGLLFFTPEDDQVILAPIEDD